MPFISPNIVTGNFTPILDRYGNLYLGSGVSRGFGLNSPHFGGTIGAGMYMIPSGRMDQGIPRENILKSHLSGFGLTLEISPPVSPIVAVSESISLPGLGLSGNGSGGTPSTFSISVGYSKHIKKVKRLSWHWMDITPGFGRSDIRQDDPPNNGCSNECSQPGNFRYAPLTSSK